MGEFLVQKKSESDRIIALVGNPNVGKSTVFNALTGLNQHTGNWPGKTVSLAQGRYTYKGKGYILVDLPGTYSLLSQSEEERVAVDFLLSNQADCILVVGDATCLERNLNLTLQVLQLRKKTVFCLNLLDEAKRQKLFIDENQLERSLGIPVVGTSADDRKAMDALKEKLRNVCDGFSVCEPVFSVNGDIFSDLHQKESDRVSAEFGRRASEIAALVVSGGNPDHGYEADRIVLGKWTGRILMVLLLILVFWITIKAANYPSAFLQGCFDRLGTLLRRNAPWLSGLFLDGIYATVARVVSVMLPPMAIFFPLFTLLEDLGYLPRAAFLMDHCFQKCGSCGRQVLTMSMGFGCNAVGVMGCRIISSPKERLIAILTNALVPCNGRFPAMITLITLFFSGNSLAAAWILCGFLLLAVAMTLFASGVLHETVLREKESHFILELPPYRRPRLRKILVRSLLDRTLFVLGRAVVVAAPAGAFLWIMQQTNAIAYFAHALEPIGAFLGMNGVILLAFILSIPANELLLPLILMMLDGSMAELSLQQTGEILLRNGWTWQTALCTIVFLMFHWPCSTTCLTIHKETGSWGWTAAAIILPTLIGVFLCSFIALIG